jgi:hypothetical protein
VALVYWGITFFLTDEELIHAVRALYDWAGPGSCLVFHAQMADADPNDPVGLQVRQIYEQMGSPVHFRSLEVYKKLLRPWQPDEGGPVSLLEWHGFDQSEMSEEDRRAFGPTGAGHGIYLVK